MNVVINQGIKAIWKLKTKLVKIAIIVHRYTREKDVTCDIKM